MPDPRPIPAITPELKPFFEAAKRHELVVQRCQRCGTYRFPPRAICSNCLSGAVEWATVSGEGEIFSFTVMHQVYDPAFASQVPYAVVIVKLKEGAKIISNLVGVAPNHVRIGMRVHVTFEALNEEVTLPKFVVVDP